ncbi:hypothetical protein DFP93_101218 [Aneurinibacillus soli]|uniref:Uncharacterized protein n=1 Tax=Aneurinibacillus soli TaxID=1500254 RepID=A0A0U5BIY5_9BACL|nr:hypothetical protein [Aneurinibacillus soli]PYE64193.1 hypothetical protein DFP93_101218 [Aneurinibacillus soli]BAU28142.1 hypothetical protein CB4_02316 [Aneurinibacillus soli]
MKEKAIEFIFKRISGKLSELPDLASSDEVYNHVEDIRSYVGFLREFIEEVIKP